MIKVLQKEVQEFERKVLEKINDSTIDHSKPYKKSKRLEIIVVERENDKADVNLFYAMQYARMFGQFDITFHEIMKDVDMKDACKAARELKEMLPAFRIVFNEYEEEIF